MKKYLIVILISIFAISCSTKKSIQIVEKEVVKDSIVYRYEETLVYDTIVTPADSSYIEAYFECDSNNNLILKQLNESEGKQINIKTIYKDNIIRIEASIDSGAIIRQAEKRFLEQYSGTSVEENSQVTTKETKRGINFFHIIIAMIVGFALYKPIMWLVSFILKILKP